MKYLGGHSVIRPQTDAQSRWLAGCLTLLPGRGFLSLEGKGSWVGRRAAGHRASEPCPQREDSTRYSSVGANPLAQCAVRGHP